MKVWNLGKRSGRSHTYSERLNASFQVDALTEVRDRDDWDGVRCHILTCLGNVYKSKKDAQEAHEAVRPTSAAGNPSFDSEISARNEFKRLQRIWQRFMRRKRIRSVVRSNHSWTSTEFWPADAYWSVWTDRVRRLRHS